MNPLVVNVAELRRQPAARKPVAATVKVQDVAPDGVRVVDAEIPEGTDVVVDFDLESLSDGIVVTGRVSSAWTAGCRRCLRPLTGTIDTGVRELYRPHPGTDDDAFPIEGDQLDLTAAVREALSLDLPLAPLCAEACAGLCPQCGADLNEGQCACSFTTVDPRWGALDELRAQLDD